MTRNEPYGDAEDPRFARYDRSGRHDDYRSSGAGSSGTRGRTPGRYDGYAPRTYRDSPARDNSEWGSRASYDGYESTGYERRPSYQDDTGADRNHQQYRGDPRRAAPPPPPRDARDPRDRRDPRGNRDSAVSRGSRDQDPYRGNPRTGARPADPNGRAPNRHPANRPTGSNGYADNGYADNGYAGNGRRGTGERNPGQRGTGERPAHGRGTGERAIRERTGTGERAAVSRGYDDASRGYASRGYDDAPARVGRPRHDYPDRPRSDSRTSREHDRYDRTDQPSRPRQAVPRDRYDRPRHSKGGGHDVDTAGRPRFVPYDYGGGSNSSTPPARSGGRSPWLVFAAACVVAVVVLVAAAMSRSGRDKPGGSTADPTATATVVPNPTGSGTGVPQLQYGQEVPITRDGAQVGVLSMGSPEPADSFYAGTYTPDRGPMFATFEVTMRNTSAGPIEYNMFEFYVRSAAGERLDPTIGRDPAFETGSIDPGETASGWISFDAGEHGTLVYSPSAFGVVVAEWPF